MIEHFNIGECIPASTLLSPRLIFENDNCPTNAQDIDEMKNIPYRKALGSLMWL